VRRKRGRGVVVAEIQKAKNSARASSGPREAYRFYLYRGKANLAAMYLQRVRVVVLRFAAALALL
jgi:hypothetical protein